VDVLAIATDPSLPARSLARHKPNQPVIRKFVLTTVIMFTLPVAVLFATLHGAPMLLGPLDESQLHTYTIIASIATVLLIVVWYILSAMAEPQRTV